MQFGADMLPAAILWPANAVALALAVFALKASGLARLRGDRVGLHLFAGSAVLLTVLWSLRAQVGDGPGLHALGVTTVTLLLGPARAALVTLAAQIVTGCLAGEAGAIAPSWLVGAVVPVVITEAIRRLVWRRFPRDPFVFLFGCAFFGSALALMVSYALAFALIGGVGEPGGIWTGAIPSLPAFLLMLGFSEGFINGTVVTMVLVLRPAWLVGYSQDYERPRAG
jgi:uncharacterized membrane protein